MRLTYEVINKIRYSNRLTALLMIHFNKGQWTIENYLNPENKKHELLTQPAVLEILRQELGDIQLTQNY